METPKDFAWSEAYTALRDQGVFDSSHGDDGRYLWLNDMEWMQPDEMAEYEPHSHGLKNIVPFAHTAAYDVYAFWHEPGATPCPVVMIADTELEYVFYAPSLEAAILRQILEYVSGGANFEPITPEGAAERRESLARIYGKKYDPHFGTLTEARTQLASWRSTLEPWFPAEWLDVIDRLAALPLKVHLTPTRKRTIESAVLISPDEASALFRELAPWDRTDEEVALPRERRP